MEAATPCSRILVGALPVDRVVANSKSTESLTHVGIDHRTFNSMDSNSSIEETTKVEMAE